MSNIKLWCSTPLYGGLARYEYMNSMMKLQSYCIRNQISFTAHIVAGESLITRARNELVNAFLKSDYTHYLSVDGDIQFTSEDVMKLIKADKDIIGATYALKSFPRRFVVNTLPDIKPVNDKPFKVKNVGTGLMLVKRHVFDKLKQSNPDNVYQSDTGTNVGETLYSYFNLGLIKENDVTRAYSEDYKFCYDWRQLGGDVWLDPTLHLKHIGFYAYD